MRALSYMNKFHGDDARSRRLLKCRKKQLARRFQAGAARPVQQALVAFK